MEANLIPKGTITTPKGFLAGAGCAGLKTRGGLDMGIIFSEVPAAAAGVFTSNRIKAAPLVLSREHLRGGRAQAIVVNSGCANACTGEGGLEDAAEMASLVADKLGAQSEDVLVASTGVIGLRLPMEKVRSGIEGISLSRDGGHELARAIMTTDTRPKEVALELGGCDAAIGGIAKGAGMIHPDLATLLCFLTTDAAVDSDFLKDSLQEAVDNSFNMITIDGDTSPNDMVVILANGLAENKTILSGGAGSGEFKKALGEVCTYLAKSIARDGEGATKLIEVTVEGALSLSDARLAARTVVGSPLVKAAVHGSDPNWGRIIAAVGRSGAGVEESKIDLYLNNICLMEKGSPLPFEREEVRTALGMPEVPIRVCLNLGDYRATAWGCDLSEDYVRINSEYMT